MNHSLPGCRIRTNAGTVVSEVNKEFLEEYLPLFYKKLNLKNIEENKPEVEVSNPKEAILKALFIVATDRKDTREVEALFPHSYTLEGDINVKEVIKSEDYNKISILVQLAHQVLEKDSTSSTFLDFEGTKYSANAPQNEFLQRSSNTMIICMDTLFAMQAYNIKYEANKYNTRKFQYENAMVEIFPGSIIKQYDPKKKKYYTGKPLQFYNVAEDTKKTFFTIAGSKAYSLLYGEEIKKGFWFHRIEEDRYAWGTFNAKSYTGGPQARGQL